MEENKQEIVKTCSCKKTYTQEQWDALPLVGYQTFDTYPELPRLEMRNCSCNSTMALQMK